MSYNLRSQRKKLRSGKSIDPPTLIPRPKQGSSNHIRVTRRYTSILNQGDTLDQIESYSISNIESVSATTMSGEVSMPLPRSKAAPRFKGKSKELLTFLEDFEACAKASKLDDAAKCLHLLRYVSSDVRDLIEALEEYKQSKWDNLKTQLLKLYGSPDKKKQYKSKDLRQIVRKFSKKPIRKEKQLDEYLRKFVTVANVLENNKKMQKDELDQLFWKGFHNKSRSKLRAHLLVTKSTHDRSKPYTRKDVTDAAYYLFTDEAFDNSDSDSDSGSSQSDSSSSDESDDSDSDSDSNSDSSDTDSEEENRKRKKKKKSGHKKKSRSKQKSSIVTKSEGEMEKLIRKMHGLQVSDVEYAVAYGRLVDRYPEVARTYRSPSSQVTEVSKEPVVKSLSNKPRTCWYCNREGAGCRSGVCDLIEHDVKANIVKRNDRGYLVFPDGSNIPSHPDGKRAAVLAREESHRVPQHTTRLWQFETEQIIDDESRDTFNAKEKQTRFRFDGVELPAGSSSKGKEKETTSVTNPKDTSTSGTQNKETADNSNDPQYKLASNVQKNFDAHQFARRMLDLNVTMKMKELIPALSSQVQKSIIDEIKPHRVPTTEAAKTYHLTARPILYHMPIGRIKATIKGQAVDILLDRGSEINVMTAAALEKLCLPLNRNRRIVMHDINGGHSEMMGVCETVEINTGSVATYAHINVGGYGDFDVLLGQPWFWYARTTWDDRDDGSWITIRDPTNPDRSVDVLTAPVPDEHSIRSSRMAWIEEINNEPIVPSLGVTHDEIKVYKALRYMGRLGEHNTFAYKPVDRKVRPIAGTMPEEARTIRHIPEDPLLTLPQLSMTPPDFVPTTKLTAERIISLDLNRYGFLWPEEVKLFQEVLRLNERALAFDESEKGRFKDEYFSPYIIPVVDHVPWAEKNIPIPPGILDEVIEIIKSKIASGVYEPSQSSYRSRWFCVKKKTGGLRIVHDLQTLNSITIRDSGLIPHVDSFVEGFAARSCYTMADIFVGYDHRTLHEKSRDLTSFQTPLGLHRLTCLPMGATNAVPEFHTCVTFILEAEIPNVAAPFIDDVGIKGPPTRYELPDGSYETLKDNPGIRRFIWEHACDVNRIFHRMGCAGGTFSAKKLYIGVPEMTVLGQTCTYEGRIPDESKVSKIKNWPVPKNVTEVRGFLGTCGVVRIWIQGFAQLAKPLVELTKDNVPFEITDECIQAMDALKQKVMAAPALRPIDYKSDLPVILAVDSSYIAVGWILSQLDQEKRKRPSRYGSISWNDRESRYSQAKIELYGLFRAIQKMRPYIIGVKKLVVEVDARYIKGMLNAPDLQPSAAMNRWIYAILLYPFELTHVPGKEHKGPDGLSRRPHADEDSDEEDAEEWVDRALDVFASQTMPMDSSNEPYEEALQAVLEFLETAQPPKDLGFEARKRFLRNALNFFSAKSYLWRKAAEGNPRRVPKPSERLLIMERGHTELAHRGGIYGLKYKLGLSFWWPQMNKEIAHFVRSCHECQLRQTVKPDAKLTVQHPLGLFRKVHLDAMLMPKVGGYRYILAVRDDLSGTLEAEKSSKSNYKTWARFLWEYVFCRWGSILEIMVSDNGKEIVKACQYLCDRYGINHIRISPYNSRANGRVEAGHHPLRESILKLSTQTNQKWPDVFHAAVWADRITIRKDIGYSPFYLAHGLEPMLPSDIMEATFIEPMTKPMSTSDLIATRARHLLKRDEDLDDALNRLLKSRYSRKALYDLQHRHSIREFNFEKGDLVLVRNSSIEKELDRKAKPRWFGPLVVVRQTKGGSYILSELDGSISKLRYGATRLIPYVARPGTKVPVEHIDEEDSDDDGDKSDESA